MQAKTGFPLYWHISITSWPDSILAILQYCDSNKCIALWRCESDVSPGNDILYFRPPTLFQICAIFLQISWQYFSSKPNILTILFFKTKYPDNTFLQAKYPVNTFLQRQISWQYFSLKPNILTIFVYKTKYILSRNIWNDMLCSSHPTPHFTLLKLLATATYPQQSWHLFENIDTFSSFIWILLIFPAFDKYKFLHIWNWRLKYLYNIDKSGYPAEICE